MLCLNLLLLLSAFREKDPKQVKVVSLLTFCNCVKEEKIWRDGAICLARRWRCPRTSFLGPGNQTYFSLRVR